MCSAIYCGETMSVTCMHCSKPSSSSKWLLWFTHSKDLCEASWSSHWMVAHVREKLICEFWRVSSYHHAHVLQRSNSVFWGNISARAQTSDKRPPPYWIFKNFNSRNGQEGETALLCQFCGNRSNCCWDMAIFQDGGRRPSWICDVHVWTTHDNMQVFIFCDLGLKIPPKIVFWGIDPVNGEQSHRDRQKALPCADTCHMT